MKFLARDIVTFMYLKLGKHLDLVTMKELAFYLGQKNQKYNKLSMEEWEELFKALDNTVLGSWKIRVVKDRWVHLE